MIASASTTVAITGAIGILGTLLGTVVAAGLAERRERRQLGLETALELADLQRLIWSLDEDSYIVLQAALERLDARLAACRVDRALREALDPAAFACWHDNQASGETTSEGGIDAELLRMFAGITLKIRDVLLRAGESSSALKKEGHHPAE